MVAKVTLSIDEEVVRRAKRYARVRKTSVSRLVEQFLSLLSNEQEEPEPPILRKLRGALKQPGDASKHYRRHLEEKYR